MTLTSKRAPPRASEGLGMIPGGGHEQEGETPKPGQVTWVPATAAGPSSASQKMPALGGKPTRQQRETADEHTATAALQGGTDSPALPRAPRQELHGAVGGGSPMPMEALPRSSSLRHSALSVRQQ